MINEILVVSLIANVFLGWYLIVVLKKLLYISTNLSDLFLTVKAFREIFEYTIDTEMEEELDGAQEDL